MMRVVLRLHPFLPLSTLAVGGALLLSATGLFVDSVHNLYQRVMIE
jgi:hypothetical protein